jgi:RNA polymerase sigma factor for flagellar operon FliA
MSPPRHEADSPAVLARIEEGIALVPIVVRQLRANLASMIDLEDLESHAREGALLAARSFDESRGVPFRRWASLRIRGATIDGIRRQGDVPRRMYDRLRELEAANHIEETLLEEDGSAPPSSPEGADARLDDYLSAMATALAAGTILVRESDELNKIADDREPADELLAREQLRQAVRDAIATRPEGERALVEKYWLEGMTLDEAAKELGLSKSWASRVMARAMDGITRALQRRSFGP